MDTKIIRKEIPYKDYIPVKNADISVDIDVIVPDTKKDAEKILSVTAMPRITGREMQNQRTLVYGTVDFEVIYLDEGGDCECINSSVAFTDVIDVADASADMGCLADCCIKDAKCRILNGRKLALKGKIGVKIQAYEQKELSVVCDADISGIEKRFKDISFLLYEADCRKTFDVNDVIELPDGVMSASAFMYKTASIGEKSVKLINNKVIVKGELLTTVIYTETETEAVKSISKTTPFTEIIDAEGINEDCYCNAGIFVSSIKCNNSETTTRSFEIQAELKACVCYYPEVELKALYDCYSLSEECIPDKECVQLKTNPKSFSAALNIRSTAEEEIKNVYSTSAEGIITDIKICGTKVDICGELSVRLMCGNENMKLMAVDKRVPFTYTTEYDSNNGNICCDCFLSVTNPSYTLNASNGADIRCIVTLEGIIYTSCSEELICDLKLKEREKTGGAPSVTVYFVKENDSLWELGKSFLVPVKKIKETNGLDSDNLKKGMKLFIPKNRGNC